MIIYEDSNNSFPTGMSQLNISMNSFANSQNSSWDGSQHPIGTPASSVTRRMSIDDTQMLEDLSFHISTPSSSGPPSRYEGHMNTNVLCAMSTITQDILTGLQDSSMFFSIDEGKQIADTSNLNYDSFQTFTPAIFSSFESQCSPSDIPSLMNDLYSPTSTAETSGAMEFVDPTQTTFMNAFPDLQSSPQAPITPIKFETSGSEFSSQRSFHDSSPAIMSYLVPPPQEFTELDTPSPARQAALRQPLCKLPQSSAALQRIQQVTLLKPARATPQMSQIKQEGMSLPPSFTVENRSTHECLHAGCGKRFKRQEHLKRHKPVHDPNNRKLQCPHCEKTIGRSDNLKEHVKRHFETKGNRTKYVEGAKITYESMGKRSRKTDSKAKPKTPSSRTRVQRRQV
ncbi:hypothetical protein ACMFMG_005668 [Clarireedia jacksonii]